MLTQTILVFLGLIFLTEAVPRPSYIRPCSRHHNFSACAVVNAQYALPYLIKGDKRLKIPNLNPVRVDFVELNTNNLNLKLKDVKVYGLEKLKILNVNVDFDNQIARIQSFVEKTVILADYVIKGHIILPITGHGPANITMYNGTFEYNAGWEFFTRNGKRYTNITDSNYDYVVDKITYDFQNLFNGDIVWGEAMNRILNENWKQVNDDLKAPFLQTLLAFHNDIASKIFTQIPYNELFLD